MPSSALVEGWPLERVLQELHCMPDFQSLEFEADCFGCCCDCGQEEMLDSDGVCSSCLGLRQAAAVELDSDVFTEDDPFMAI